MTPYWFHSSSVLASMVSVCFRGVGSDSVLFSFLFDTHFMVRCVAVTEENSGVHSSVARTAVISVCFRGIR